MLNRFRSLWTKKEVAHKLQELFPPPTNSVLAFNGPIAAATYLKFLHLNSVLPYDEEDFIHKATNRYKKYFDLAEDVYRKEDLEGLKSLVPTRDISFVWATHMIHPHLYRKWRKQYFGGCEGKKLALNTWFSNQHLRVNQNNTRDDLVKQWKERYRKTTLLWEEKYSEDYLITPKDLLVKKLSKKSKFLAFLENFSKLPQQKVMLSKESLTNEFGIDLHAASERHLRFAKRVIDLKKITNHSYLMEATERYHQFLSM